MKTMRTWTDLGISGEERFLNLFFDPHSESLVAQFGRLIAENAGIKSLYLRQVEEKNYHRLSPASERLSYEDVVLTPNGPHIFVNVMELLVDNSGAASEWYSVQKIELPSGKVMFEINRGELQMQAADRRVWISRIIGTGLNGQTIFCNLGIQQGGKRVHYYLVRLHTAQKRYELITELTHMYA